MRHARTTQNSSSALGTGALILGIGIIFGMLLLSMMLSAMLSARARQAQQNPGNVTTPAPSANTAANVAIKGYETATGDDLSAEEEAEIQAYAEQAVAMMEEYQVTYGYAKTCTDTETIPELDPTLPAPNPFKDSDILATVPTNFKIDPADVANANASNISKIAAKYITQLKKSAYKNTTIPESCNIVSGEERVQESLCLTEAHLNAVAALPLPPEAQPYIAILTEICRQAKKAGVPCNAYITGQAPCNILSSQSACTTLGPSGACSQ